MAASLLSRRKIAPFRVSSFFNACNVKYDGLNVELDFRASDGVCNRKYSSSSNNRRNVSKIDFTDLTSPHTWYPKARRKKRSVFLHVGPTNSGKTYHALKRLQSSPSGIYCGPLRLLAWEVANRLNKAEVPCDLITGQEVDTVEGAKHKAVTVEMADVNSDYSCAVVDEIQMIGCKSRGFSFTRALLGISADEIHLCGDPAVVPLVQQILEVTGDDVKVELYERLLPLVPLKKPLGSFANIQTGDCIVTFSRREIYKLKVLTFYYVFIFSLRKELKRGPIIYVLLFMVRCHQRLERDRLFHMDLQYLLYKVFVSEACFTKFWNGSILLEILYKGLQATMFNDASSELDVLVASDAIGMGLNLNISRIIFSTMKKFDGVEIRDLTVPEIKQIAGRAGRYGSKFPVGEVTCLDGDDLPLLHSALQSPSPLLERAGLFPTFDLMYMHSLLHPKHGLYEILEHFVKNATLSENYFISDCEDLLKVAVVLDELPLSLHDKYLFCISPVDMDDEISAQGLTQFASNYAKKRLVRLKEIFTPGSLKVPKTPIELQELESVHKVLDLYVWLSYRLDDSFPDRELAASQKAICSMLIEEFLERFGWDVPRTKKLPTIRSLYQKYPTYLK
ncbi:DExH-box ATP-dependent RNA helicase DExH16, mitochondrial [Linum grandiflorum]